MVELTSTLVETLRGTIPPPGAGNWIFSDYPRLDATFPRISVTQVAGSFSQIGIGEKTDSGLGKLCTIDYDIDIWVKVDDRVVINNETYVGTKLRDKYAELVVSALEAAKPSLKENKGILDIEFVNITTSPLDEETMLHRKTVTVRLSFIWEHD